MKIELESTEEGWKVSMGDRYEDRLGSDEALWCVVAIMTNTQQGYTLLKTQEAHDAFRQRYAPKPPLEDHQKLLPVKP